MVDRKTGLKPKTPKAQKLETSNKKIVKSKTKAAKEEPKIIEAEKPISNSELLDVPESKATTKAGSESAVALAKAGKHSAKAIREAQELAAKEARKKDIIASEDRPKTPKKPARPKSERAGKKYREAYKLVDKTKTYSVTEALELAIKTATTKFDSSVELHINLGVDPKQADHNIRGMVNLPAGAGKKIRVAVFAEGDEAAKAKTAGADLVGGDDFLAKLDKEQIDFDILITTPSLMPRLGKYARLLGPKGLMPNPKSGSITTNIPNAVTEARAGRVEYRLDPAGIIHLAIGKVSFGPEKISQNAGVVLDAIKAAKPASLKGTYIKSFYITTTMGPSIKISL
ncbi:50S ribosomal protein L1 [Candidatus Saccharibacteria bacterium]|nr:50S ribosomal protein L1 [Candidatus Saccharibacteria bacterium]